MQKKNNKTNNNSRTSAAWLRQPLEAQMQLQWEQLFFFFFRCAIEYRCEFLFLIILVDLLVFDPSARHLKVILGKISHLIVLPERDSVTPLQQEKKERLQPEKLW